jgi:hypothetical protein
LEEAVVTQEFLDNRARIPLEKLISHRGEWIAFNAVGTEIVANGTTHGELLDRLQAMGIKGENVVLEGVPGPDDDICLGAGEWM